MSNVLINNRMINNQKIRSLDIQKVNLPFNVSKEQVNKLTTLLCKIQISLNKVPDNLEINSIQFNSTKIKPSKNIPNSKFTLKSTYVATIKSNVVEKVISFYQKLKPAIENKTPVFNISAETNLQQALREATTEIPIEEINKSLNTNVVNNTNIPASPSVNPTNATNNLPNNNKKQDVVIANSPYEDNNIKMNSNVLPNNNVSQMQFVTGEPVNNQNNIQTNTFNAMKGQYISNNQNVVMPQQLDNQVPQTMPLPENAPVQPNVKVKKLSGKVLTIPIVIIWLGLVLVGSIKLVTSILT